MFEYIVRRDTWETQTQTYGIDYTKRIHRANEGGGSTYKHGKECDWEKPQAKPRRNKVCADVVPGGGGISSCQTQTHCNFHLNKRKKRELKFSKVVPVW